MPLGGTEDVKKVTDRWNMRNIFIKDSYRFVVNEMSFAMSR
ncbi:hypothetical protein B4113_1015 [Geobacillus sp. B4113_201601]|nr:hypothetical protein B4113_1015 [Geobacillus sp. B4113_201601]